MKDKLLQIATLAALVCLLIGIIGKLISTKIIIQNFTWMNLSQTIFLFAISIGITRLIELNKK